MGAETSKRSRERFETKEDRAKETDSSGNTSISGTTDYPAQGEISSMGSPTDQVSVRSPVFLENGTSYPQETRAPYSDQTQTATRV
jgi:hypothetical protein